ncbi:hypothetical protein FDG2_1850 [Candidatus Protofrankia californiensis]|uniref:Uncharacterized protein n=1 Tax=Candidatus Protofrankia californiensis TaxID=1839754 RepID=A0A1C3NWG9_9ACTN|nr:hypothetical protein FDG2_1850 [Candidatus Protofrankia californiensis]
MVSVGAENRCRMVSAAFAVPPLPVGPVGPVRGSQSRKPEMRPAGSRLAGAGHRLLNDDVRSG